ncbi:MAG: hypothetical protein KAF91_16605 [Nostoc sp. TH1S01]|nr:hypothetical protein [Nostoc sp. TH1S01]
MAEIVAADLFKLNLGLTQKNSQTLISLRTLRLCGTLWEARRVQQLLQVGKPAQRTASPLARLRFSVDCA